MRVPTFFLVMSFAAAAIVYFAVPAGQGRLDALFLIAIIGLASAILLLIAFRRRKTWIVLDGSNIMYWAGDDPDLDTVIDVLRWLEDRQYAPVIWFDANVGYKVAGRFLGPQDLARILALSGNRVFVAPKGTPADPLLLADAVKRRARVVSNDRFRDWHAQFPRLKEDGFVVKARRMSGNLTLDL